MRIFIFIIQIFFGLCQRENHYQTNSIPQPFVVVEQGKLKGMMSTNWKGGKFFSFLNIPYAKKPIRELRFKDPLPPEKWDGIRDATTNMPRCIQHNINQEIIGKEDCLYLNVHTYRLIGEAPVMVFIHGGDYLRNTGSSEMLGPEYLMAEEIVLVSFNYRLGFFGFLNFENSNVGVPGNAGLKDQVMALEWVKTNIAKFGGDPNKITIFGQDVGGTSVHLHMMSPISQPLFHQAIALSGTALHTWSMGSKDTGLVLGRLLGYRDRYPTMILKKLQRTKAADIMEMQEDLISLAFNHKRLIGPIIESEHNGTIFLSESPFLILTKGAFKKCPFILGATNKPSLFYDIIDLKTTGMINSLEINQIIPYTLQLNRFTQMLVLEEISQAYKLQSFEVRTREYRELLDDLFMNYFVYVTVKKHLEADHKEMYLYKFSASTRLNLFKFSNPETAKVQGASHYDDIGYLFRASKSPSTSNPDSKEAKCLERFIGLFVNFAKTGHPTLKYNYWTNVTEKFNYLDFKTESMKIGVNPFKRMDFWDGIYKRFGSEYFSEKIFAKKQFQDVNENHEEVKCNRLMLNGYKMFSGDGSGEILSENSGSDSDVDADFTTNYENITDVSLNLIDVSTIPSEIATQQENN
nr:juvenile hormone esterase-like [Onthophagus taurus]